MKKIIFLLSLISIVGILGINSCKDTPTNPVTDTTPTIEKITPSHALEAQSVTIVGKNFGDSRGSGYVQFNGVQAATLPPLPFL